MLPLLLVGIVSAGYGISHGNIPQIYSAYYLMVLSELNSPLLIEFRKAFLAQTFLSW